MRKKLGSALEQARLDRGLSRELLARELNLSVALLEAIEQEEWNRLPPGQERPVTRQLAERLGVDPARYPESWETVPGSQEAEPHDPGRELLERTVMGMLTLGSVGLLLWLVVPGPRIRTGRIAQARVLPPPIHAPAARFPMGQAFPVLGEVLPEVPINEEGVLVSLRALDTCSARIESEAGVETRMLQVSEPWRLRLKGPFTLHLDNSGVVKVEVAGRAVLHGQSVGEAWEARFGADGQMQREGGQQPKPKQSAPETDPEPDEEGGGGGGIE